MSESSHHFLIIGVGSIGERHLRNFLRVDSVRCSIAETNADTRRKIAGDYPVEADYADYRDADLASFDGVVICIPAHVHVPVATDIVRAGTHVLTEKPLSTTLEGIDELKRLRDEKGVVVSVAFPQRSNETLRELKRYVDAGNLGRVRLVNWFSGQYWPDKRKDYPPQYAQSRFTGGGVIQDHMVHFVNVVEWLFGPTDAVCAAQWNLGLDDIETEDTGFLTMRMAGGQFAHLGTCLCQADDEYRFKVVAEHGVVQMISLVEPMEIHDVRTGATTRGDAPTTDRDDIFVEQAKHFIRCIEGRDQPRCTVEEAEQTLRTILAAHRSSDEQGQFVEIGQV